MFYLQTIKDLYLSLPDNVKRPMEIFPPKMILGKEYREQLKLLKLSNQWSGKNILSYQHDQLFKIIEFAATTVPYYREVFRQLKLPNKFTSVEQIQSIPFLTKEIVQEQGDRLISEAVPRKNRYKVTTGGTSGTPMEFWMSSTAYGKEWAFVHDLNTRFNIYPDNRKIGLRGVAFPGAEKGRYYRYNPVYRELQISPFHLTEEYLVKTLPQIVNYKAVYLHGYPSAVVQFAALLKDLGVAQQMQLKGVLLVSESVQPGQVSMICDTFKCPVYSFYGHSERLIFAGNCIGIDEYLIDPRYGYAENINGEFVGTGFINTAMPMLRYRTGDYGKIESGDTGKIGIKSFSRMSRVEGRWLQEMVVGKSDTLISITALNMHSGLFKNVQRYQFYQDTPGKLELRVIPSSGYGEQDETIIKQTFKEKVGKELILNVKSVDSIDLTKRGKQMYLIQKLPLKHIEKISM